MGVLPRGTSSQFERPKTPAVAKASPIEKLT